MSDPLSLFVYAFSGSDAWRPVWLGLIASLAVTPRRPAWVVAIFAFLLDRAIPFLGMADAYDREIVLGALFFSIKSLPQDSLFLALRFALLLGICALFWRLRLALHGQSMVARPQARS